MRSIVRFTCTLSLLTIPFSLFIASPTSGQSMPGYSAEDLDGDRILNEYDMCPETAGFVELGGCSAQFNDFDGDDVEDDRDNCPYSRPFSSTGPDPEGCSMDDRQDQDFDGIMNGRDLCPEQPGWSASDFGCPPHELEDNDRDRIINALDICPDEFGSKALNGCPSGAFYMSFDFDQDGVDNFIDHCPFTPDYLFTGPNGCAEEIGKEDEDQDGVPNAYDQCRASPAGHVVDDQGCTGLQALQRRDNDEDGIPHALDVCPGTPPRYPYDHPMESVTQFGCLIGEFDGDYDGIPDFVDECPWEPGHRRLNGCSHPPGLDNHWQDADFDGTPHPYDQCLLSKSVGPGSDHSGAFNGCQGEDLADFDGDGVINGRDRCPASREGMLTDEHGCNDYDRLDLDQDGLINGVDLCPRVAGLPFRNGCSPHPYDADEDGVDNHRDHCPYSLGGPVDEHGCAMNVDFADRDGDRVEDMRDECPGTPVHEAASPFNGCSPQQEIQRRDSDGDGIVDEFDYCPDTAAEVSVDHHGCPLDTETSDRDGDNVENQEDRCPDTPHAKPITPDGCEIFFEPRVERSIHRPFPNEIPDLELFVEDIPVEWGPFVPGQRELEIEHFEPMMFEDFDAHSHGDFLHVHIMPHNERRVLRIPLRVRVSGTEEVSNWFELVIGAGGATTSSSLIINDPHVLDMTGISLRQAFGLLNAFQAHPQSEVELFRQFWDSQRSQSMSGLPFFCTGEINSFPVVCDRPETDVVFDDDFTLGMEMENYRLTAVVNRLDLHDDWQDCGEHRLVFARQDTMAGRMFINLEARLPNPMPGDIQGCRSFIDFWANIANVSPAEQAQRLSEFFYGGSLFAEPAIHPTHFLEDTGQVRSLQFMGAEWLFKEHKMVEYCGDFGNEPCRYAFKAVSVKENPFGPLFDPHLVPSGGFLGAIASDFQQWFPHNLNGLLTNNPAAMHNRVDDRFNHGQSHASGPEVLENDYLAHFAGQHGSEFAMQLDMAIQGQQNADGSPLNVEQVLARATAMTCAGCHAPDTFLSNFRDQIGVLQLPNGTLLRQWPLSHDFVHINEAGALSPALEEVFLPARQILFDEMLRTIH